MENIKKFLELIYNSDNGMLYFYVITGSIALILIVLIIVNIKKGKKQVKEDIQVETKPAPETVVQENIQVETKPVEEPNVQENIDDKKVEVQNMVDEKPVEEPKVEEVIEETNNSSDIPKVEEVKHEDNIEVNVTNLVTDDNTEVKVDALDALYKNQEIKNKESNEDEIELPKVKENSDLSSESFMERLNALKNK